MKKTSKNNAKNLYVPASLTVEAALVLPVFIYSILVFMFFLQILFVQETIQAGLTEVAKSSSNYAFLYETIMKSEDEVENNTEKEASEHVKSTDSGDQNIISSIVDGSYYHLKLREYVEVERINRSCIIGGYNGISFLKSSFMEDGETVDVVAVYRIRFPVLFFNLKDYTLVQRVRTRGFIGKTAEIGEGKREEGDSESQEKLVYITETGTVYHVEIECTHLKLSISALNFQNVAAKRNTSGGKYKACEVCCKKIKIAGSQTVYITNEGDRYHNTLACSGLKRTIMTIGISKVGKRKLCSRCGE